MLSPTFPVTAHTQRVGPGSTFVAIKGAQHDGRTFIADALARGATQIIVDDATGVRVPPGIKLEVVADARRELAVRSARVLKHPSHDLHVIGITGTSGKTTTTWLLHHIFTVAGFKTALLGGIYNILDGQREQSRLTTPSADYLQMFLAMCRDRGVTHVFMEVSSHALATQRTQEVIFSGVGFTNLTPEHLDFHQSMDDYFATKAALFAQCKSGGLSVIPQGDEWQERAGDCARRTGSVCTIARDGDLFTMRAAQREVIRLPELATLPGSFNQENGAMAAAFARAHGISPAMILAAWRSFPGVPGRMQRHKLHNGAVAFVDYAHKPGALQAVLATLRTQTDHLIVLFGCGGDRDARKRPIMGACAARYADQIILTNDNPRTEDPACIVEQIMRGMSAQQRQRVTIMLDRAAAIAHAAQLSRNGSCIALLGKGHETAITIGEQQIACDDFAQIQRY